MHDLKQLVACDMLEASFQDTPRWEIRDQQLPRHDLPSADVAAFVAAYRTHYWQGCCSLPDRTGDLSPVTRISDHVSDRQWHSSGMYADVGRAMEIEHELMVWLDAGAPQRTLRLLFSRGPGSDFSERDVAVLTLLRPHLQAAYVASERRRRGLLPLTRRQREILQYVASGYPTTRSLAGSTCPTRPCASIWRTSSSGSRSPAGPPPSPASVIRCRRPNASGQEWAAAIPPRAPCDRTCPIRLVSRSQLRLTTRPSTCTFRPPLRTFTVTVPFSRWNGRSMNSCRRRVTSDRRLT